MDSLIEAQHEVSSANNDHPNWDRVRCEKKNAMGSNCDHAVLYLSGMLHSQMGSTDKAIFLQKAAIVKSNEQYIQAMPASPVSGRSSMWCATTRWRCRTSLVSATSVCTATSQRTPLSERLVLQRQVLKMAQATIAKTAASLVDDAKDTAHLTQRVQGVVGRRLPCRRRWTTSVLIFIVRNLLCLAAPWRHALAPRFVRRIRSGVRVVPGHEAGAGRSLAFPGRRQPTAADRKQPGDALARAARPVSRVRNRRDFT